jgi:hypothetical protein
MLLFINPIRLWAIQTYSIGLLLCLSASLQAQEAVAQQGVVHTFTVTQNNENPNQLTVTAADTTKQNSLGINGTFVFYVNGFTQLLRFKNGVAKCLLQLSKSSFVYFKHENEANNPSNLYYVYKSGSGLSPFKISWFLLLMVPVVFILIGYMFKKIIGLAMFALSAYLYFGHSSGLSVGTFLASVFDGLKNIF